MFRIIIVKWKLFWENEYDMVVIEKKHVSLLEIFIAIIIIIIFFLALKIIYDLEFYIDSVSWIIFFSVNESCNDVSQVEDDVKRSAGSYEISSDLELKVTSRSAGYNPRTDNVSSTLTFCKVERFWDFLFRASVAAFSHFFCLA